MSSLTHTHIHSLLLSLSYTNTHYSFPSPPLLPPISLFLTTPVPLQCTTVHSSLHPLHWILRTKLHLQIHRVSSVSYLHFLSHDTSHDLYCHTHSAIVPCIFVLSTIMGGMCLFFAAACYFIVSLCCVISHDTLHCTRVTVSEAKPT